MARSLRPDSLVGYSLGEFVAHAVSGALAPESALRALIGLVDCLEQMPLGYSGAMTAVLAESRIIEEKPEIFSDCWLAAINRNDNFVLAGNLENLNNTEHHLKKLGIVFQRLDVEYPFHSPLIEPAQAAFKTLAESLNYQSAQIPVLSSRGIAGYRSSSAVEL